MTDAPPPADPPRRRNKPLTPFVDKPAPAPRKSAPRKTASATPAAPTNTAAARARSQAPAADKGSIESVVRTAPRNRVAATPAERAAAVARPPAATAAKPQRSPPPMAKPTKKSDAESPPWAVAATPVVEAVRSAMPATRSTRRAVDAHPADASTRSMAVIRWLTSTLRDPWRERIREYLVLMRMDRPVGALLLLWPTWWGLWFAANDFPPIGVLIIFTVGVFVMRSAGCVINDYADHDWLDGQVERTRNRPMAAGRVSKKEALWLFVGLLAFAFLLVLLTNALTIKLAFAGAALAALYPFCKRYTHLAQVVLGAAFGWSIPMAFAAVTGEVPALGWLLFLANVLFSTIYDTEYAMVDRDDDIRAGAKSTAILFADADRPIIGVLMLTFLFAMLLAGTRAQLVWPYFVGLGIAAGLCAWQLWLIRRREREACFTAFRNNNWVGFVLWIGLLLALAIR